jgi:hypothetical protein
MLSRFITFFAIVAAAAVLSSCSALIPKQELQSFRASFVEAQKAGDLLYDEISVIIDATEGRGAVCGKDRSGTPKCFDPHQVSSSTRRHEDPSVRARRLALELVSEYTLALVEVAEGARSQQLKDNIGQATNLAKGLAGLGSSFLPGLPALLGGPVVDTFTNLAVRLEGARSAGDIRQSLINERATIAELIDLLIEDTSTMYEIYYRYRQVRALQPGAAAMDEIRKAADYHEALTAYVLILQRSKAAHENLVESARVTSIGDLRLVIQEATELRASAQEFWNAIRDVRR